MSRFYCTDCTKSYSSKQGLSSHIKKFHPFQGEIIQTAAAVTYDVKPPDIETDEPSNIIDIIFNKLANLEERISAIDDKLTNTASAESVSDLNSEVFAHVTDIREQVVMLAKKSVKYCVVCFEKENSFAFQPCRHKCVCKECAQNLINKTKICPICRVKIVSAQAIYDITAWDPDQE